MPEKQKQDYAALVHRAARAALWVACILSATWFFLLSSIALVMSTGLADEPGDTNGLKRFAVLFAVGLPGLVGWIVSVRALRRQKPIDTIAGFDVTFKSARVEGHSDPTNV